MKKARSGAGTTRTGKGNSPDNVTPWGKHAKSCVPGKGEGREMNPYFPVHFVHWGRHFPPQIAFSLRFPYHKKMHPGGGQNIIKGERGTSSPSLKFNKFLPLSAAKMGEFALQHTETHKVNQKMKKGEKYLPFCFGAARADYPGLICLGKLKGNLKSSLKLPNHKSPQLHVPPSSLSPRGKVIRG